MLRILLTLFLLFQSLHAFLNTETNYPKQLSVLKEFDLPVSFLKDSLFISMKEDVETYKTKHFLKTLENGDRFAPILQKMMKEGGVPVEFLYLAMTESSFNPYSSSPARAAGLWQFIPGTAKVFKLTNDSFVDERRDPIKSTQAAVDYLNRLHKMFGKWYLAALAYNCGEGALSKAIAKAGTDDITVLLDESKKYLPKESRMYIRKILMMSFISNSTDFMLENESEHLLNRANNATFLRVELKGGTLLSDVSQSIGISYEELKSYNPHLKRSFVSPLSERSYVYIPQDKQIAFSQNFDDTKEPQKYSVYVSKKGDSLQKIAKKYGTNATALMELNNLKTAALKPKMEIIIPSSHKPSPEIQKEEKTFTYVVKAGDTVDKLAQRFAISVDSLLKANQKKTHLVKAGERIVVPKR